jgi:LPPG:FO 2-phospho-L-lactate transferase
MAESGNVCVLAGGVGAAKFLAGLVQVRDPATVTAVVNVADDMVLHGLHISPDLDTVLYTLAGEINLETGWGLAGETWSVMDQLDRLGGESWFRLGDTDLATHLFRTQRMRTGATLSMVTAELAATWGVGVRLLPVSNEPVRTLVTLAGDNGSAGREVAFQEWFVGMRHAAPVASLRFTGLRRARPAPGVLEAIDAADVLVVAPSNPLVSIDPVLAVPDVGEQVAARRDRNVAVSPIVAGRALKGPADRLMADLGHEPSVVGVARLYAPLAATLVIDTSDADRAADVEAAGMRCVVAPTIMSGPAEAAALAEVTLAAVSPGRMAG